MKKEELYQFVLEAVCRHTGIDKESVFGSRKEECVDARYILVHVLSSYLTDKDIAGLSGKRRQQINYIRNNFGEKIKKWGVSSALHGISAEIAGNKLINAI